ncbi:MAG: aminoacyl-tRNA deacylase [Anaerolineae bacterium]
MAEKSVEKTNAMRALEQRHVAYTPVVYGTPTDFHAATEVADIVGEPYDIVYKTLVVLRDKGKPLLVMIAADREVDLRLLAKSVGEKRLRMATLKEAEKLTGLQVGGISALALLGKGFEALIDAPALAHPEIYVSAGRRGTQIRLAVADLVRVTQAKAVAATSDENREQP